MSKGARRTSKGMEAFTRSKASAGVEPNRPPQSGVSFEFVFSSMRTSLAKNAGLSRETGEDKELLTPGYTVPGYTASDSGLSPVRRSRRYFLTALLTVERPIVALRVRLPTISLPMFRTSSS